MQEWSQPSCALKPTELTPALIPYPNKLSCVPTRAGFNTRQE